MSQSTTPTAPFQPATAKLTIGSLDKGEAGPDGVQVSAHYNPKELQVDKSIPWNKVNQANQANTQGIHLEFTGAEGRTMTVDMLFDNYETNGAAAANQKSVADSIAVLEKLASVINPASTLEDERRPRLCVVSWGSGMPSFRCVIESISTKYTMMTTNGVPLRATCTVKLKEADVVTVAQAGAATSTTPGGGTTPSGAGPSGGGPAPTGGG